MCVLLDFKNTPPSLICLKLTLSGSHARDSVTSIIPEIHKCTVVRLGVQGLVAQFLSSNQTSEDANITLSEPLDLAVKKTLSSQCFEDMV